jgi:hypothetical protein
MARLPGIDVVKCDHRRRQQTRVDGSVDVHSEPAQLAGLGLERAAVMIPIDNKGRHQRRHER